MDSLPSKLPSFYVNTDEAKGSAMEGQEPGGGAVVGAQELPVPGAVAGAQETVPGAVQEVEIINSTALPTAEGPADAVVGTQAPTEAGPAVRATSQRRVL